MDMIGAFKLIFHKYPCARADILAQDVGAERANSLFLRLQFQVDPECLTQDRDVLFLCEPWREVSMSLAVTAAKALAADLEA